MLKNMNGYLLSTAEAANRLGVAKQTLRRWKLPRIKLGKKIFYEEQMIEKLLEAGNET